MTSEMCGLIKSLNDFSKNARKSEDPEPEIVSVLLETGHILVEEERGEIWPITFISDADFATASRAERV
ncbi:hypothetical protein ACHAO4_000418 [Trichoderma viride]